MVQLCFPKQKEEAEKREQELRDQAKRDAILAEEVSLLHISVLLSAKRDVIFTEEGSLLHISVLLLPLLSNTLRSFIQQLKLRTFRRTTVVTGHGRCGLVR